METGVPISLQPLIDAYLHALEPWYAHFYGIYISGSIALDAFEEPERWQFFLDEAWRIRHHLSQSSLYRNRIQRMRETLAFIEYVRERGGKALEASSLIQHVTTHSTVSERAIQRLRRARARPGLR